MQHGSTARSNGSRCRWRGGAEIAKLPEPGDHVELVLDDAQLKALRTGIREGGGPLSWRFPVPPG